MIVQGLHNCSETSVAVDVDRVKSLLINKFCGNVPDPWIVFFGENLLRCIGGNRIERRAG